MTSDTTKTSLWVVTGVEFFRERKRTNVQKQNTRDKSNATKSSKDKAAPKSKADKLSPKANKVFEHDEKCLFSERSEKE